MNGNFAPPPRSLPAILPAGLAAALLGLGAAAVAQPTNAPPQRFQGPPTGPSRESPEIPTEGQPAVEPPPGTSPFPTPTSTEFGTTPGTDLPDPALAPTTTYLDTQLPFLPWLPADTLQFPEWATQGQPQSPFLRPGLGTSSLGGGLLPAGPPPARDFGISPPIRFGPIDLRPGLQYQALYGSGLLSGQGREEDTWLQTITPELNFYAGDHWTVSYSPAIRVYSADGYKNSVDHVVSLGGWASYKAWQFHLNHLTAITSDPLIETARQTDQTTHSTGLGATWAFRPRSIFNFSISQNIRLSEDTFTGASDPDYYAWASQAWYDYSIRPALKLGVGLGFGYDMVDPGTDMVNERLNVRASGPLGEKLRYVVSAGAEFRQFVNTDASTSISPLAAVNLSYQILQKTALSAGVSHDVGASYFSDQFTENTSLQGGVSQILTPRWRAAVNGGYRFSSYQSTFVGTQTTREDSSTFANVSVTGQLFPRLSLSLFYFFNSNESDQEDFSFDSHQVGLRLNWAL